MQHYLRILFITFFLTTSYLVAMDLHSRVEHIETNESILQEHIEKFFGAQTWAKNAEDLLKLKRSPELHPCVVKQLQKIRDSALQDIELLAQQIKTLIEKDAPEIKGLVAACSERHDSTTDEIAEKIRSIEQERVSLLSRIEKKE